LQQHQEEDEHGFVLPPMDDNDGILPDAQPFSPRARDAGNVDEAIPASPHETQQSEESAAAPARRVRTFKPLTADNQVELRSTDIREWDRDYITNMAKAAALKSASRAVKIAKQNAEFWIWQMGIAGIGGNGGNTVAPELEMFYGDRFIHAVLGIQGQKRDRASAEIGSEEEEEEGRRTRQRTLSPRGEEVGRGNVDAMIDDDGLAPIMGDVKNNPLQHIHLEPPTNTSHPGRHRNGPQRNNAPPSRQHHRPILRHALEPLRLATLLGPPA